METSLPKGNNSTTHRQMRSYSQELLRRNVIEAAGRLLMEEGPDALTVRRVAQELECSTKIIYTMFHGKDGLANALYREGCALLHNVIAAIPEEAEAEKYMLAVARAYWSFALTNTSYYLVMFCGAIPGFTPDANSIATTETAFETVVAVVRHYMEQGVLKQGDPVIAAKTLWAALHGVVSLHLQGHFHCEVSAEEIYEYAARAMIASFLPSITS